MPGSLTRERAAEKACARLERNLPLPGVPNSRITLEISPSLSVAFYRLRMIVNEDILLYIPVLLCGVQGCTET